MTYQPSEVETYVKGSTFPASGTQLAGVAALNDAPLDLLDALRTFENRQFENSSEVVQALAERAV